MGRDEQYFQSGIASVIAAGIGSVLASALIIFYRLDVVHVPLVRFYLFFFGSAFAIYILFFSLASSFNTHGSRSSLYLRTY
jgi:hypothetical protein